MKTTEYTTRVLTAEDGYMLTQSADVPPVKRQITKTVYLAATDSPDSWREITEAEAAEMSAARAAAEAEMEEREASTNETQIWQQETN